MNYTKVIRDYCIQNEGIIFDVSYERKHHFDMVPYKTLLKILNRLEDEGVIVGVAKGIYAVTNNKDITLDEAIKYYYTAERGMLLGYELYNKYELTEHKEKPTVILTCMIDQKVKLVGDYKLIKANIDYLTDNIKNIIEALEIIQNANKIIDLNHGMMTQALKALLKDFDNYFLRRVLLTKKYSYSTFCSLDRYLKVFNISGDPLKVVKDYGFIDD